MRRAAEHLGTTQSALTKAVRRLESELHIRFFDRAPRGVELTEPGRAFLARVKSVDLQLSQALHEIEHMRLGELGLVRLGCTAANFEPLVKPVLERFLQDRPQARFALSVELSARLIDLLLQGRLDLVVAGPASSPFPELEDVPLFEEKLHAIVREGHPLLQRRAAVDDLARCRWILPPAGRIMRRWVEQRLRELGMPPPTVVVETDASLAVMNIMVRSSDLVSVMTERMLATDAGERMRSLERLMGASGAPLVLSWRRDSYLSPLVRDFREALRKAAGSP